ncbi:Oidioi.mRNA.OKI2018_I69.chr1.g2465.t1.cds [Oikopleura dioica]|uniref:Oidioi.mRNA.OKI2018_I69.chr1.g2465.t1.cds n=1 Tax=Oikopleura dioica TaxID=34765 RepID=A0ABN7SSX7_OIKDI|nr:Oidioi.mRNA.OKI2018_I69.chr1.g2465.t1.cds [Oikopleura dioica]
MKISFLLSLAATGTDSQAPNSRMVLTKLSDVAAAWADFYIKDVLSRDNRAENFKQRIKNKTDRIAESYEKCRRNVARTPNLLAATINTFISKQKRKPLLELFLFLEGCEATCKPQYNRKRKRRSPGVRELGGGNLFNPDGSKLQDPIPLDPTRSSKQIFNNLRNWIWEHMDGCRQQGRFWHKLGQLEQKWLGVYADVLEKVDARRSG